MKDWTEPAGRPIEIERAAVAGIKADLKKSSVRITLELLLSDESRTKCGAILEWPEEVWFDVTFQPMKRKDPQGSFSFKDALKSELAEHPLQGAEVSMNGEVIQPMTDRVDTDTGEVLQHADGDEAESGA